MPPIVHELLSKLVWHQILKPGWNEIILLLGLRKSIHFWSQVKIRRQKRVSWGFASTCLEIFTRCWAWSFVNSGVTSGQILFTRPKLRTCRWLALQVPSSLDNVRELVLGGFSTVSNSLIFDSGNSTWLLSIFETFEQVFCHTFVDICWALNITYFAADFALSPFFL